MGALTANRDPQTRDDEILSILVEDNVHIYRGAGVCVNAAGYATPAADTAGNVFLGIAREECDNTLTGHTQGGKRVTVFRPGSAVFAKSSAAQTDIGLEAFISDDQTVVLAAAGTEGVHVGTVIDVPSSSTVRVALSKARPFQFTFAIFSIPVILANLADGDIVTTLTPGFAGEIVDMDFVVTDPVTTASKLSTLNAEIGTTNLTGGTVALTSANCDTLGKVVAAASITGNNSFGATDTISAEASSTTTFIEGEGVLIIRCKQLLQ